MARVNKVEKASAAMVSEGRLLENGTYNLAAYRAELTPEELQVKVAKLWEPKSKLVAYDSKGNQRKHHNTTNRGGGRY